MKGFDCSYFLALGCLVHRLRHQAIAFRLSALACLLAAITATAQETPRFEIGGGLTVLNHGGKANVGPGFTGVYNITRYLSLEGSFNWFPTEAEFTSFDFFRPTPVETSAVQGLFGAKVGYRTSKYGVFAKVRPGLISASNTTRTSGFITNLVGGPVPIQRFGRLTEKALDFGGVFEYYPAKHWALRADVGDTLIFDEGFTLVIINNITGTNTTRIIGTGTSSHFQFSVGGQFRF